jgi:hypothetical protein
MFHHVYFYKKKQWRPTSKKKKRGKNLSPRNRQASHTAPALPSILKNKKKCRYVQSPILATVPNVVLASRPRLAHTKYKNCLTRKSRKGHQAKRRKEEKTEAQGTGRHATASELC